MKVKTQKIKDFIKENGLDQSFKLLQELNLIDIKDIYEGLKEYELEKVISKIDNYLRKDFYHSDSLSSLIYQFEDDNDFKLTVEDYFEYFKTDSNYDIVKLETKYSFWKDKEDYFIRLKHFDSRSTEELLNKYITNFD